VYDTIFYFITLALVIKSSTIAPSTSQPK